MSDKIVPLSNSFMVISMFGFVLSGLFVVPKNAQFGFAFCLIFVIMFIASVVSMTHSQDIDHLQIDYKRKKHHWLKRDDAKSDEVKK